MQIYEPTEEDVFWRSYLYGRGWECCCDGESLSGTGVWRVGCGRWIPARRALQQELTIDAIGDERARG